MNFFFHAPLLFIAASAAIGWQSFRPRFPLAVRLFSAAWTLWFLLDAAGHVMAFFGLRNLWLYNLLYVAYFPAVAYAYQHELTNPKIRAAITVFYPLFFLFAGVNTFFVQGLHDLQTATVVAGGTFLIFLSASFFRQLYQSEDNEKITREPFFWFSCGLIICYGGTVPFIGMLNYLVRHFPRFARFYYVYFYDPFFIVLSLLTATGFLCRKLFPKSR